MNTETKPCLLSCGILKDEIEKLVEEGSFDVDLFFLDKSLHNNYDRLERALEGALQKRLRDFPGGVIVVYGDVCLGFHNEMKELLDRHGVIKVDALNCVDCLLGGKGRLLEVDPEHEYFFLTPAWIEFLNWFEMGSREEIRKLFSPLKGIVLLDSLGDLDDYREEIEKIGDSTGLPLLERREVGLEGLRKVITEAMERLEGKTAET